MPALTSKELYIREYEDLAIWHIAEAVLDADDEDEYDEHIVQALLLLETASNLSTLRYVLPPCTTTQGSAFCTV